MVYLCVMSDWHFVSERTRLSLLLIKIQLELDMNVLVWGPFHSSPVKADTGGPG